MPWIFRKAFTARYFDYQTGKYAIPDPATAARITAAREKFVEELKKDLVTIVIRMDLSTWAIEARVSSLFSGI